MTNVPIRPVVAELEAEKQKENVANTKEFALAIVYVPVLAVQVIPDERCPVVP